MLRPEYEWERFGTSPYSVVYDARDELYKCWYMALSLDETDDSTIPGSCYAESRDGIEWHKPILDLFEWNGKKSNFVQRNMPGTIKYFGNIILRDDESREDYRYQGMLFRYGNPNEYMDRMYGYYTAHSADGIH